jgi:ankyrin repeat protein
MIEIVPEQYRLALSMAIAKGELDEVKGIVKQYATNVDAYIDVDFYKPVIMAALSSYGFKNEQERLPMLKYFLENAANPNRYCKAGYNCLHIAAQQEKLVRALHLFLDFNGDVNLQDNNGATATYWAIQSFSWAKEGAERQNVFRCN